MDLERIRVISELKTKYQLGQYREKALEIAAACFVPRGRKDDGAPYGYHPACYDLTDQILFRQISREDQDRLFKISLDDAGSECANHMLWNLLIAMDAATPDDGLQ